MYLHPNIKRFAFPHLLLDYKLLLENIFYINKGLCGKITEKSIKIDGRKLNIKELKKNIKNILKNTFNHEILVEKKINLKKYLQGIVIFNIDKKLDKKYTKLTNLIKKEYSDVKIISFTKIKKMI